MIQAPGIINIRVFMPWLSQNNNVIMTGDDKVLLLGYYQIILLL